MRFEGTSNLNAPREAAWAFLTDPEQVSRCIPAVDDIQVIDTTHFRVTSKLGVSFVKASVAIDVVFTDLRAPEHARITAHGRAQGLSVEAAAEMELRDGSNDGTTLLVWSATVDVSGRLKSVASRMIHRYGRWIIALTVDSLKIALEQRMPSATADGATPLLTAADVMRFDPNWCLFWGKPVRPSQLETWLPYLRRSRRRFAIMSAADEVRSADREKIGALPNAIIIEPWEKGLEWLHACRGFRGFLYVGSQPENFLAVNRQGRKAHVYIGHGESGKGGSGFRTASLYDSILVAQYGAVQRFPAAIRPWVWRGACAIGTPIVEGVRKDAWSQPRRVRTILYAPTWETQHEASDYASVDEVAPILIRLLPELTARGIEVVLRPHPATGRRRPELRDQIEELEAAGALTNLSKKEAFERADVLISDISGVTAEFLLTEKPSVLAVTPKLAERGRDGAWIDLEYPWVYRWDVSVDDVLGLIMTIETTDPLRARRAAAARRKFRHHRSLDDAVRTFDIALATQRWRTWPVPLRVPFESELLVSRIRHRPSR